MLEGSEAMGACVAVELQAFVELQFGMLLVSQSVLWDSGGSSLHLLLRFFQLTRTEFVMCRLCTCRMSWSCWRRRTPICQTQ